MKRINYFDYLRILATLSIILAHIACYFYSQEGYAHLVSCFWAGFVRWGIYIFIMISGTIFLNPEKNITLKSIFTKYIFRILVVLYAWSFFYACSSIFFYNDYSLYSFVNRFIHGHYHLWFLFMIISLYFVTPYIRPLIEKNDKALIILFLAMWFVLVSLVPFIIYIYPDTKPYLSFMNKNFSIVKYIGCFVLGYYLHNFINIKSRAFLYFTILISLAITILGDMVFSLPGKPSIFAVFFPPFTIIVSVSIFLLLKSYSENLPSNNKIILNLSKLTLGVYLIHPFYLQLFLTLNWFNNLKLFFNDNYFFTIPIMFIFITILSFFSIFVLSKIKFIGKYFI